MDLMLGSAKQQGKRAVKKQLSMLVSVGVGACIRSVRAKLIGLSYRYGPLDLFPWQIFMTEAL